ncbi:MAG: heme-binding protein, partial [Phycisphaerales bacterium]|nr:heme-binding protein [Phycisphaerales bacterium]
KTTALLASAALLALAGTATFVRPAAGQPASQKPAAKAPPADAKADPKGMVPVELAGGKTTTASSYQDDGLKAEMATDGDAGTRWCAQDGQVPQWLQVDLGKPQDLGGCRVEWEQAESKYARKIEGSADGKAWTVLADREYKPAAGGNGVEKFDAKGVRYVRLTVTGTQPGAWASVKELEVFGTQLVAAGSQKKPAAGKGAGKADAAPTAAGVKAPGGWNVSVFAAPPDANYPTTVCAMPNGDVFVGIDEMGSLGREKGRGRVVRLRDTDGDGKADQVLTVAKMDNPRGVWVDGNALYVLHPPFLEKYTDADGDGVYEASEVLVRGITVEATKNARGADHTTNGFRVGPDGWAYVAMGDFGALEAVGKDGAKLQSHGGGVVRVRLDGSGLEQYSFGQRNIYDVAVDPFGNCFTRDNTNDGGGWNVRISHVVPSGNFGYPRLFVRFGDEIVQPLNDYGGGSPCGALWVEEPRLPGIATGLLTVEWGASKVYHHPLVAAGAGYKAPLEQEQFLALQRPTDIDYDGRGSFYVTSWANGSFSYSGQNVGYVAKVKAPGVVPVVFPEIAKASDADLLGVLAGPAMKAREAAQREILRRGDKPGVAEGLENLAGKAGALPQGRAAAVFTLKQLRGSAANPALAKLLTADVPEVREVALRALADKKADPTAPLPAVLAALKDADARVRLTAAWAAGRLAKPEAAAALLPLLGDDDGLVRHVAINALVALNAVDPCLGAVDGPNAKVAAGALLALQQLHDTRVVDGLAAKLASAAPDAAGRAAIYRALCRLHFAEAEWDGSWWGTRPDTSGPYYKTAEWAGTAKVKGLLEAALKTEKPEVLRQLVVDMQRHKIVSPAVTAYVATAAKDDPAFRAMLVDQLAGGSADAKLTPDQLGLLGTVAANDKAEPDLRAKAIRALGKDAKDPAALDATVAALATIAAAENPPKELADLLTETIRDAKYAPQTAYFAKVATAADAAGQPKELGAAKRELGYAFLIGTATSRLAKPADKEKAAKAIDAGWATPA